MKTFIALVLFSVGCSHTLPQKPTAQVDSMRATFDAWGHTDSRGITHYSSPVLPPTAESGSLPSW
jgi:hypothetical protein